MFIHERIGLYKNGNFSVSLFADGTKVRMTDDDEFIPEFAENCDVKITNYCDMKCEFCHEDSNTEGLHGDILNAKFLDTLHPYTEMAIGGGNPLSHPDLVPFLEKLRDKKVVPNLTVHQHHFLQHKELLKSLTDKKLIYGLGISLIFPTKELIEEIKKFPNAVIHVINGITTKEVLETLADNDLKMLILGYKDLRRGTNFLSSHSEAISKNQEYLYENLQKLLERFNLISFDNLALEQLDVKRLMSDEDWEQFFMGEDGTMTFYIDLVKKEFASSSTSKTRFPLKDSIDEMFQTIRKV